MNQRALLALALFVSAGVLLWAVLVHQTERHDTAAVVLGDVASTVSALGTLYPANYVDVGAQVSGQIRRIHVEVGADVEQGALLMEIDPRVQQAKVDAARAALADLDAQLLERRARYAMSRQEHARQQQLDAAAATSTREVQAARAERDAERARIASLEARIEGARSALQGEQAQLGYTRIYAPIAGTVVMLDARVGQTLNAMQQTPLVIKIADLSTMTVWTDVSEADIARVSPGMPAWFTTLGDHERRWNGAVRQVLPAPAKRPGQLAGADKSAGNQVVLYTVLFDVANPQRDLLPEMSAQVFFQTAGVRGVPIAPMQALRPIDGHTDRFSARVVDVRGQVRTREVTTGVRDRLHAEIKAGLAVGDQLVLATHHERLADGLFRW